MATKQMRNEKLEIRKVKMGFPGKHVLLCSFLFSLCSFVSFAQDLSYFLDTSGSEPRFIQHLSWIGDENASRYEVVFENEVGGRYQELHREFTTALFIEVSLAPGKYRCHVIPSDFLNRTGEVSWISFEVLTAIRPELDDALVEFVYSDKDTVYEMIFFGKGLVPGADIYLRVLSDARVASDEHIVPSEVYINEDGSEVQLFFNKKQLTSGDYELIIKNPGGLETSRNGITVTLSPADRLKINLFLTAAWMPSITIYDKGNRFFDDGSPIGAAVRLGIIFTKPDVISLGAELTEAWSVLYDGSDERATHIDSTVNFFMRKQSPAEKTALTFRLGIGLSLPLFGYNDDSPPFTDLFYTNTGVSLLVFVWNNLYMEGGIDYAHWFSRPFSGNFRPWVGVGWRF
jgi:hypothetical protein